MNRFRQPQFIFCFSYLYTQDRFRLLHRTLMWRSINSPRKAGIQLIQWVYWCSFRIWRLSYLVSRKVSSDRLKELQVNRFFLFWQFLRLGLIYNLSPQQCLQFDYLDRSQRSTIFKRLYNHQLPTIHHYANRHFPRYLEAVELIGDKQAFETTLQKNKIPTTNSQVVSGRDLAKNMRDIFQEKTLFCKPTVGAHANNAFLMKYNSNSQQYSIQPIHGAPILEPAAIAQFLRRLPPKRAFMVQPFLESHPDLIQVAIPHASTTLRVITVKGTPKTMVKVGYAQLEVPIAPTSSSVGDRQNYAVLPLNLDQLTIDQDYLSTDICDRFPQSFITPSVKHLIQEAIQLCIRTHDRLLNLKGVAFDLILTKDAPIIIEANFNWAIQRTSYKMKLLTKDENDRLSWDFYPIS